MSNGFCFTPNMQKEKSSFLIDLPQILYRNCGKNRAFSYSLLHGTQQSDDFSENGDLVEDVVRQRFVFGVQDKIPVASEEALDRVSFFAYSAEHGYDDVAVIRSFLFAHNDGISVKDAGFNHTVARDGEQKQIVA